MERTLLVDLRLLEAVLLTPVLELAGHSSLRPRFWRARSTLRPPTVLFRARKPEVLVLTLHLETNIRPLRIHN